MPDNLRHAQYGSAGIQVDDPQKLSPDVVRDSATGFLTDPSGNYLFRVDLPGGSYNLHPPIQHMLEVTAALSTTAGVRVAPTSGGFRTALITLTNKGASGSANLLLVSNTGNDVEGLVGSQSTNQRDYTMSFAGAAVLLISPVDITSLFFSADGAIVANTYSLNVTFGM